MPSLHDRLDAVERALLAGVLASESPAALLADVEPESFSSDRNRAVFERLSLLHREHGRLDHLTVATDPELRGDIVQDLVERRKDLLAEPLLVERLRAGGVLRDATEILAAAQGALRDAQIDPEVVSDALGALSQRIQETAGRALAKERDRNLMPTAHAVLDELQSGPEIQGVRTGIPIVDRRLGGGMHPGTLTGVLGRSGHGKSCFGITSTLHAARGGRRVLYVSREMLREELFKRLLAADQRMPLPELREALRRGDPNLEAALWQVGRLQVEVEDAEDDIERIVARVERERLRGEPYDLVVLDYLQLFRGPGKDAHEKLQAVAYIAKACALRNRCAVQAMIQPNREGSKETGCPRMSSIHGSSGIEKAMDSIISIDRLGDPRPGEPWSLDIVLEKARNGQPGELPGAFRLGAGTFLVWEVECGSEAVL